MANLIAMPQISKLIWKGMSLSRTPAIIAWSSLMQQENLCRVLEQGGAARENSSNLSPLSLCQRAKSWLKIRASSKGFWEAHSQISWTLFHPLDRDLPMFIQPAQDLPIRSLIRRAHVLPILTLLRSLQMWLYCIGGFVYLRRRNIAVISTNTLMKLTQKMRTNRKKRKI